MKRSEMVAIFIKAVKEHCYDENFELCEEEAGAMLQELEKAGMKPPSVDKDRRQALMSVYYGGYTFHQWDEDFEKNEEVMEAYNRRLKNEKK